MVSVDFALQNPTPCRCDQAPTLIEVCPLRFEPRQLCAFVALEDCVPNSQDGQSTCPADSNQWLGDIGEAARRTEIERAHGRCEYCLIHEDSAGFPHQIDHIV